MCVSGCGRLTGGKTATVRLLDHRLVVYPFIERERRMKKTVSVLALASIFAAGSAYGSGYRIPEQNADSTAKAGAHVASALGPDAAYFNPANLSWLEDRWQIEGDLTYIHLTSVDYTDTRSPTLDGSSEKENFVIPTIFATSPSYNDFRFGFSITTPYGLAKRWEDPYPGMFSRNFELKTFDINPTVTYKVNDMFSVAGGVRLLYGEATAKNVGMTSSGISFSGDIEVDALEWGYNLAVAVRPNEKSNISITYRSHIDMDGDSDNILMTSLGSTVVTTSGDAELPAPAVLTIAGAYTFDKLTVELAWDRTFWSEYEDLDFNFDTALTNPILYAAYDVPKTKDWDDASAYRLSLEYKLNDIWTLLGGFAYDENPIPDETLGFETPDSDAWLFSIGTRYKYSEQTDFALGLLYDYKESRTVSNGTVEGKIDGAGAILVSLGMKYKF